MFTRLLRIKQGYKVVLEYNKDKQGVDIPEQLSSYYTSLRKSLIWYKKLPLNLFEAPV